MLTTDVFLHPREGDATLPAALAETQQEGSWRFGTEERPLPLLADEAHDVAVNGPGSRRK